MTRLERQLQDILDALMNYEVPVDSSSVQGSHNPSGVKRSKKLTRSPSAASHDDTTDGGESETEEDADRKRRGVRLLCELYETAPVEEIAEYRSMVRRVLDLETIRDNLRQHRYSTVRAKPQACATSIPPPSVALTMSMLIVLLLLDILDSWRHLRGT